MYFEEEEEGVGGKLKGLHDFPPTQILFSRNKNWPPRKNKKKLGRKKSNYTQRELSRTEVGRKVVGVALP